MAPVRQGRHTRFNMLGPEQPSVSSHRISRVDGMRPVLAAHTVYS